MLWTIRYIRSSLRFPFLLTLFCLALPMRGQDSISFKTQDPGKGFVEVGGNWHFHTGDDLAWAQPEYDDSGWEQMRGDETWGAQTHPSYVGFAWYRKPIEVTGASGPLTILMPPVDDVYELYWNGKKIGDNGKVPPHAQWDATPHATTFPLPTNSGMLAVRVWKAPLASVDTTTLGGMEAAPRIGDSAYLALQTKDNAHGAGTSPASSDGLLLPHAGDGLDRIAGVFAGAESMAVFLAWALFDRDWGWRESATF